MEKYFFERKELLDVLAAYRRTSLFRVDEEADDFARLTQFIESDPNCFERTNPHGHITASALLVDPGMGQVLLTLHRKLGKWLQLGGHADGHPVAHEVALKEAEEESGLTELVFAAWGPGVFMPFDIDIHEIPARPEDPAHFHYDIRYLIVALGDRRVKISEESSDLKWWSVEAAVELCPEPSMQRIFKKLLLLRGAKLGRSPSHEGTLL